MPKTRGELEAEFTKAIIKLEKEYLGRGPLDARTFFVDDMVLVRLRGVLTQAEQKLAESEHGSNLIKETRRQQSRYGSLYWSPSKGRNTRMKFPCCRLNDKNFASILFAVLI